MQTVYCLQENQGFRGALTIAFVPSLYPPFLKSDRLPSINPAKNLTFLTCLGEISRIFLI